GRLPGKTLASREVSRVMPRLKADGRGSVPCRRDSCQAVGRQNFGPGSVDAFGGGHDRHPYLPQVEDIARPSGWTGTTRPSEGSSPATPAQATNHLRSSRE